MNPRLVQAKSLLSRLEAYKKKERLSCQSLPCGVPRGALTEISGTARVEWIASFLKEHEAFKVFWLEKNLSLFPPALIQRGVNASRFVIVEGGKKLLPILRKAIRSQAFECIISPNEFPQVTTLKSIQLLSERSNTCTFLLANQLSSHWPITLQFEVHLADPISGFQVHVRRNKGGNLQEDEAISL